MVGGFIDWYFRINPVYFLFLYTVATFVSYIVNEFNLLIVFGIAAVLQVFWMLCKLIIYFSRLSDSNIKELYGKDDDDDVDVDQDMQWFQKRMDTPEIRKSLKYRTASMAFLGLLIGLIALYLWTVQNYIVSILLILFVVAICFRICQAGYMLMKN